MTIEILDGQTTTVFDPNGEAVNAAVGVTQTIADTPGDDDPDNGNIVLDGSSNDGTVITNAGTLINLDTQDENVVIFIDNGENDVVINNDATGVLQGVNGVIFAEGDALTLTNAGLIEGTGDATEGVVYFDRDVDAETNFVVNSGTITSVGGPAIGVDSLLGSVSPSSSSAVGPGVLSTFSGLLSIEIDNSGTISNTGSSGSDSAAIFFNGDPGNTSEGSLGGSSANPRGSLENIDGSAVQQINSQIDVTLVNSGTISATDEAAILSADDAVLLGTITNTADGTITGDSAGIEIGGSHAEHAVDIINAGDIVGTGGDGLLITGDGVDVVNQAGGLIEGTNAGLTVAGITIDVTVVDRNADNNGSVSSADVAVDVAAINNTFTNSGTISGVTASVDLTNAGEAVTFTQTGGVLTGDFLGTTAFDDSFIVGPGAFTLTDDILQTVDVTVQATGDLILDGTRTIDGDLTTSGTLTVDLADTHLLAGDLTLTPTTTLVVTDTTGLAASAADGDVFTLIDVAGAGAGSVTLDVSALSAGSTVTFTESFDANGDLILTVDDSTINGTSDDDTLTGGPGDDIINGFTGNDTLSGLGADDTITGGNGNDILNGNAGFDTIAAGNGNDTVFGGAQNDFLIGGAGDDTINGGAGSDTIVGGSGDDTINGGNRNDVIRGNAGEDTVLGGNGDDIITTGTGSDIAFGGAGNDSINGFGGFDILNGGTGDDILTGGSNADTFQFNGQFGNDTITDFAATNDFEVIDFSLVAAFNSFEDVQASLTQVGNDAIIDNGSGNSITLLDVNIADLDAADFVF